MEGSSCGSRREEDTELLNAACLDAAQVIYVAAACSCLMLQLKPSYL